MRTTVTWLGATTAMLLVLLVAVAHAGSKIVVEPGEDTILEAVADADAGDTLYLEPGLYVLTQTVVIDKDLTIKGSSKYAEDVHIAAVNEEFDDSWDGHIFFVTDEAENVYFANFTIKGAPELERRCGDLNPSECNGDGIHTEGVKEVTVKNVHASLNGGNGIFIDGAEDAELKDIVAVNNGAFGVDVDSALALEIKDSTFIANQISGIEAAGHVAGTHRKDYSAKVSITDILAMANGEIGIEIERFASAEIEEVTSSDNREDGFDADRVSKVEISESRFINNLGDGLELFPVKVPAAEQPADFPGSIREKFKDLVIFGNVGEEINHPETEN